MGNPFTETRGFIIVKHHQRTDCPGKGGGWGDPLTETRGVIIVKNHQRADCPGGGGGRGEGRYSLTEMRGSLLLNTNEERETDRQTDRQIDREERH